MAVEKRLEVRARVRILKLWLKHVGGDPIPAYTDTYGYVGACVRDAYEALDEGLQSI